MITNPISLTDLTATQIMELTTSLGEPSYRAEQLQYWIYKEFALSFDEMINLPKRFRQGLAQKSRLHSLAPLQEVTAKDGTSKILFRLIDGKTIESTLMPYPEASGRFRHTVCLSSQVGCPIGCPLCATGQQGFERNLSAGEIIDQVLYFARRLKDKDDKISPITNLVFMGMGEPLANYDAVWQAIERLNQPQGFGLGARNITISTAGLVPQIRKLSQEKIPVGLAISLHASENWLRDKLVPINKKYPLEELILGCRDYFERTGRRPSFEYVLLEGINDSIQQAGSLAQLLSGLSCHVNLIPANRTANQDFRAPRQANALAFQREMSRLHVTCTLRQRKGLDIDAGCGQLRSRFITQSEHYVPTETTKSNHSSISLAKGGTDC